MGRARPHPDLFRAQSVIPAPPAAVEYNRQLATRTELTMDRIPDIDPQETREWLDALDGVLAAEGPDRAHFLIEQLIDKAHRSGAYLPFSANTAYINTIPVAQQVPIPGDQNIEHRIRSITRWNAMAMVVRANKHTNVGGHFASFASGATLYDVGFNHFWHGV
jgi:pyruvate dehydrogenase E1 component